jgi:hypothetical protein
MYKKYFAIFIILGIQFLLIFLMDSCRKNKDQIAVQGRVTDPNTNINVEGASVVLSANIVQNGVYSTGYDEIARTNTDAGGNFSFAFKEERYAGYRIYISKAGYYSYTADISANDLVAGETYTPVYEIYPIGYIKLKVVNAAPYDTADVISYSFTSGYLNCFECCDHSMHIAKGIDVNDSLKCKTNGNHDVVIAWNVKKNNVTVLHTGSIYCKAFDTVSYQINY